MKTQAFLLVFAMAAMLSAAPAGASSSSSTPPAVPQGAPGCCDNPAIGETIIDVLEGASPPLDGVVGNFYEPLGVVFPPATHAPVPFFPTVRVRIDQARPEACDLALNRQWAFAAGDPPFPLFGDDDEAFQFWDGEALAVDRVRVSVGYINDGNHDHTVVVRAYDCKGELLEEIPNQVFDGFEVFDVDRQAIGADIHYIVVSAPADSQGVSINCIQYPENPAPCDGTVSTESSTWGEVKSGYR